jgi:hypothetical protein
MPKKKKSPHNAAKKKAITPRTPPEPAREPTKLTPGQRVDYQWLRKLLPKEGTLFDSRQFDQIKTAINQKHQKNPKALCHTLSAQLAPDYMTFLMRVTLHLRVALEIAYAKKKSIVHAPHVDLILYLINLPFSTFLQVNANKKNIFAILRGTNIPEKSHIDIIIGHLKEAAFARIYTEILTSTLCSETLHGFVHVCDGDDLCLARLAFDERPQHPDNIEFLDITNNQPLQTEKVNPNRHKRLYAIFSDPGRSLHETYTTSIDLALNKTLKEKYISHCVASKSTLFISITMSSESYVSFDAILSRRATTLKSTGYISHASRQSGMTQKSTLRFNFATGQSHRSISNEIELCLTALEAEEKTLGFFPV